MASAASSMPHKKKVDFSFLTGLGRHEAGTQEKNCEAWAKLYAKKEREKMGIDVKDPQETMRKMMQKMITEKLERVGGGSKASPSPTPSPGAKEKKEKKKDKKDKKKKKRDKKKDKKKKKKKASSSSSGDSSSDSSGSSSSDESDDSSSAKKKKQKKEKKRKQGD